jgi:protein-S-isoprenylcysteine O-methyltransferase Ste14
LVSIAAVAFLRWLETAELYFFLLIFRDLLGAYLFYRRVEPVAIASRWQSLVAYVSTFMTIGYLAPVHATALESMGSRLLAIFGFLLVTLATIDLWDRFGVTAAKRRDVVRTGLYRWLSHPMYVGYGLAEFGQVLLNPFNAVVYAVSMSLYFVRARAESRLLRDAVTDESRS